MPNVNSQFTFERIASVVFVVLILAGTSLASKITERTVYKFLGSPDGASPESSLVADSTGNLYGTTVNGGIGEFCCGTVFELNPPVAAGGGWTETLLYTFQGGSDGASPVGTLLLDKPGNLYGTTNSGGTGSVGTIFELMPPSAPGGAWTKATLWNFGGNQSVIAGKLVMDAAGNIYGTTEAGGSHNAGIVFELVAPKTATAPWAERVLYDFHAFAGDGYDPGPDLLLRGGILYGTTMGGGAANKGTVFQLVLKPGLWTETILHSFVASEGSGPRGGLIADSGGNLYGTLQGTNTSACAGTSCGGVYELSPPAVAGDPWQETTLFTFSDLATGADPYGALRRDKLGNLYGTTIYGGIGGRNLGTVFKLKPPAVASGAWTEVVLHYFRSASASDGFHPLGALILVNGTFYGTTRDGDLGGTVFSISFAP